MRRGSIKAEPQPPKEPAEQNSSKYDCPFCQVYLKFRLAIYEYSRNDYNGAEKYGLEYGFLT